MIVVMKGRLDCFSFLISRHSPTWPCSSLRQRRTFTRTTTASSCSSSSSSSSPFTDPVLVWAAANRDVAQACLNLPPKPTSWDELVVKNNPSSSKILIETYQDYWKWRQWDFSAAKEQQQQQDKTNTTTFGQNLTTHVLTDPLTIAMLLLPHTIAAAESSTHRINHESPPQQTQTIDKGRSSSLLSSSLSLKIGCLGARAEASLPPEFWKEMLLLAHATLGCTHLNLTLDFIGPEIQQQQQRIGASHAFSAATVKLSCPVSQGTLQLRWMYRGVFHEFVTTMEKHQDKKRRLQQQVQQDQDDGDSFSQYSSFSNNYWDAFCLLNPGIGHENMIQEWKPTLDLLFSWQRNAGYPLGNTPEKLYPQQQVPLPILFTAHSWLDAQRDAKVLVKYLSLLINENDNNNASTAASLPPASPPPPPPPAQEPSIVYRENPWASRIQHQDPLDPSHMVQSNQYYHVIV